MKKRINILSLLLFAASFVANASTDTITTALGPVIPVFGYDDGTADTATAFQDLLKTFPCYDSYMAGKTSTTIAQAPVDNYALQGVKMYLCANTPWTRALRTAMGLEASFNDVSDMSPTGAIVDIIIFLDKNLNQVALQVPGEKLVYGTAANNNQAYLPKYILNPAIKYYVSLVSGDLPGFQYKYTLDGTATDDSTFTNTQIASYFTTLAKTFPELAQQLFEHKEIMLTQYVDGPFGRDGLTTNSNLQLSTTSNDTSGNPIKISLYTGINCPPIPMGDATVPDYIVPLSSSTNPVTLPDSTDVSFYFGLVTGMMYHMIDGYLVPYNFNYSPITVQSDGSYTINSSTDYYALWPSLETTLLTDVATTFDTTLKNARAAWLSSLTAFNASTISIKDATGLDFSTTLPNGYTPTGGAVVAKLFSSASAAANCPIWLLANSPLDYGLFIAANNITSSTSTVMPVQSSAFNASTLFVDLVSGYVINQAGEYQPDDTGSFFLRMNATSVLNSLGYDATTLSQKSSGISISGVDTVAAFTPAFTEKYSAFLTQYTFNNNQKLYPIPFGNKMLGIYRGDKDAASYIYWTYNGSSMTDYFVTLDMTNGILCGPFNQYTDYIVSVVNGQIYSKQGPSGTFDNFTDIVAVYGNRWDADIQDDLTVLSAADAALQEQLEAEAYANAQAAANYKPTTLTESDSDRAAIAARLDAASFLLYPYDELKQDSSTGKYYRVELSSDTDTAGQYYYLDFDAPNSGVSTSGTPVQLAAAFDNTGTVQLTFDGVSMYNYRKMYGVAVSSADRTQSLGAASIHSILVMSTTDKTLTAGESGTTMLISSDPKFPTQGITSPLVSGDKTYYFYYSTVMKGYYALVNDSTLAVSYWLSMADGSKYNLDGTNRASYGRVAFGANTIDESANVDDNLLLIYENASGSMSCVMPNNSNANVYTPFYNYTDTTTTPSYPYLTTSGSVLNNMAAGISPYNSVKVAQSAVSSLTSLLDSVAKATMYDVYWDSATPTEYDVDDTYNWTRLRLMNNSDSTDQYLYLVYADGDLDYAIFGGELYTTTSSSNGSYNMSPLLNSSAQLITITPTKDAATFVAYVVVTATDSSSSISTTSHSYSYQYEFDGLSSDELSVLYLSVWGMQPVAASSGQIVLAEKMDLSNLSLLVSSDVQGGGTPDLTNVCSDDSRGIFYGISTDGSYVDLVTGVKYDVTTGVATGGCLWPDDLTALLTSLNVSVGVTSSTDSTPCLFSYPAVTTTATE
jgi:hypothetical protein